MTATPVLDPAHALAQLDQDMPFNARMQQLITLSRQRHANTFDLIQWPETIEQAQWWLPPELLSVHGTAFGQSLSELQLMQLSKWECINAFSLNVEGERDLINLLSLQLYAPQMPGIEAYLHHFIDEENKHLWFFGQFCRRYGGKIYTSKKMAVGEESFDPAMDFFLVYARIYLFEEIGAYYNVVAGNDERVNPFVRSIHLLHHADEARHITFGRSLLKQCKDMIFDPAPPLVQAAAVAHLQRYLQISVEALYQPAMYRDSGIGGVALRRQLLDDPARRAHHAQTLLKRPLAFMQQIGIPLEAHP